MSAAGFGTNRIHRVLEALLGAATLKVTVRSRERERGKVLEILGFGAFDALHIACAESAGAEVFLTTDDSLRLRASREASKK
jgi:predicted nucleic acid-binding protein